MAEPPATATETAASSREPLGASGAEETDPMGGAETGQIDQAEG